MRGLVPLGNSFKDRPIIIVTDEDECGFLVVCTSKGESIWADKTTLLSAGCHPLIDKNCSIVYGEAEILSKEKAGALRALVERGKLQFDPSTKLASDDLQRIQKGFGTSNGIPLEERDLKRVAHEFAKARGII